MPINETDELRLTGFDSKARSRRMFTNKEMEQALRDAAQGLEGPLSREVYQARRPANAPHSYTIIRRYGKWNDALKRAKLPIRKRAPYRTRMSKEDCVDAILVARDILGHLPSVGEYTRLWSEGADNHEPLKEYNHPAASTIRMKFDKWRSAVTEASQHIAP